MCRLVETIRIENGKAVNLEYHNRRMASAIYDLFRLKKQIDLREIIMVPAGLEDKIVKCRIIYRENIEKVEYQPYSFRKIMRLRVIGDDIIDYRYKYSDRSAIDKLFSMRGDCDDILIVKNGFVTDTSYANIIFRKSGGQWITPATCLLKGTRRESLLDAGLISEESVTVDDIQYYKEARLINAMMGIDDTDVIPVANIIL